MATFTGLVEDKSKAKTCQLGIGTPCRLKQLITEGILPVDSVCLVVLDEADKLLGPALFADTTAILNMLPKSKQVLAMSTTYTGQLASLADRFMQSPQHIVVTLPSKSVIPGLVSQESQYHPPFLTSLMSPTLTHRRKFKTSQKYNVKSDLFKQRGGRTKSKAGRDSMQGEIGANLVSDSKPQIKGKSIKKEKKSEGRKKRIAGSLASIKEGREPSQTKGEARLEVKKEDEESKIKAARGQEREAQVQSEGVVAGKEFEAVGEEPLLNVKEDVSKSVKFTTSLERKLACSEERCQKKVRSPFLCKSSRFSPDAFLFLAPGGGDSEQSVLRLRGGGNSDSEEEVGNKFTFANSDSNDDSNGEFKFANDSSNTSLESENESVLVEKTSGPEVRLFDSLPTIYYPQLESKKTQSQIFPKASGILCSKNCHANCRIKTASWSTQVKDEIRGLFAGLNLVEKKNKLLMQILFQKSAGLPTTGFFFNEHLLCVNYFALITSISSYLLTKVIKDFLSGYQRYIHGNSYKKRCQTAVINFCSWMKVYSSNFGQDGPTDVVTILPSFLNKADLYKIYRKESPSPHVKENTMYKIMKTKFGPKRENKELPWIRISKFSTHSRCDVCLALDQFMRKARTAAEIEYGRGLKMQHSSTYSQARIAVNEFIQKSITFPNEFIAFQLDSMDNQKSMLPRVLESSKQLSGLYKLPCKITGCVTTSSLYPGNRKLKFYTNHGKKQL